MMGQRNQPDDFWSYVRRGEPNECWPFGGSRDKDGYGRFWIAGQYWRAHRYAWQATHGQVARLQPVLHDCDNPPCCNPAHLHLGSIAQNNAERAARGRSAVGDHHPARLRPETRQGERNGRAKLTAENVRAIRREWAQGEAVPTLALRYGVHPVTVDCAVQRKTWKTVQ